MPRELPAELREIVKNAVTIHESSYFPNNYEVCVFGVSSGLMSKGDAYSYYEKAKAGFESVLLAAIPIVARECVEAVRKARGGTIESEQAILSRWKMDKEGK